MAVIFSEVPADFGSVFGELIYVVEGVEAGQTATVELYLADGEQPVGAKVVRGGEPARVNMAACLRRCIAPEPVAAERTGFVTDGGRCAMAALLCGDRISAVRSFTGAVRQLTPYEVLTALPLERTIGWEERDEVSLCVPDCSMTCTWTTEGVERQFALEAYVAQRGIVTLAVVMADLRQQLEAAGVAVGEVTAVTLSVTVAGEEKLRVRYRIVQRVAGSVRLCWFNRSGGCDCHTFAPAVGERRTVTKAWYAGSGGRDAQVTACRQEVTLTSGYLPEQWLQGVAELAEAPLVWRLGGAEPVPVTVEVPEMVWRTTEEPDAVTFVVQEKKMRVCQCF